MAPDVVAGGDLDVSYDIYAMGVVLWEMLTSKRLFGGEKDSVVLSRVLAGNIAKPSDVAAVPPELDAVVMRALSKRKEDRYPSARAFAEAIADVARVDSSFAVAEWFAKTLARDMAIKTALLADVESYTEASEASFSSQKQLLADLLEQTRSGSVRRGPHADTRAMIARARSGPRSPKFSVCRW